MILTLYGLPHSGKSSLGLRLEAAGGFQHVNLGGLLRQIVAGERPCPYDVQAIATGMAAGRLLDDHTAAALIGEEIARCSRGHIILDGFPRTLTSIPFLEEFAAARGRQGRILVCECLISPERSLGLSLQRGREMERDEEAVRRRIDTYLRHDVAVVVQLSQRYPRLVLPFEDGIDANLNKVMEAVRGYE